MRKSDSLCAAKSPVRAWYVQRGCWCFSRQKVQNLPLRRNRVDLARASAALVEEYAPARLIELAVPDELARDELSEPVEQLARKGVGVGDGLGIA